MPDVPYALRLIRSCAALASGHRPAEVARAFEIDLRTINVVAAEIEAFQSLEPKPNRYVVAAAATKH